MRYAASLSARLHRIVMLSLRLLRYTLGSLHWLASVYAVVTRATPLLATSATLLSVLTHVLMVASFLLPLKVILLVGAEGMPWYLRDIFPTIGKDELVAVLVLSAIAAYALYLLSKYLGGLTVEAGARIILAGAHKIPMFENQQDLAAGFYRRLCDAGGALLFVVLGMTAGMLVYPTAFWLLGAVLFLELLIALVLSQHGTFAGWLDRQYGQVFAVGTSVAFFAVFLYLILDMLRAPDTNLILAIATVLLLRQILLRLTALLHDSVALVRNHRRIDSLFRAHSYMDSTAHDTSHDFWHLLDHDRRNKWLAHALAETAASDLAPSESLWCQLGVPNVAGLWVRPKTREDRPAGTYLVKLFGKGRRADAMHEASLLSGEWATALPAPWFQGALPIGHYHCLVYCTGSDKLSVPEATQAALLQAISRAWQVPPPTSLVDQYYRSRPPLARRIGPRTTDHLHRVADSAQQHHDVADFQRALPHIQSVLTRLPVYVHNPDMGGDALRVDADGNAACLYWGRWSIEPVGAGWPVTPRPLERLDDYLRTTAPNRADIHGTPSEHVRLAALMFAFTRRYNRQAFASALELLPSILDCPPSTPHPQTRTADQPPTVDYKTEPY